MRKGIFLCLLQLTPSFIFVQLWLHELVTLDEHHHAQRCNLKRNTGQYPRNLLRGSTTFLRKESCIHYVICKIPLQSIRLKNERSCTDEIIYRFTEEDSAGDKTSLKVKVLFDNFISIYLLTVGKSTS